MLIITLISFYLNFTNTMQRIYLPQSPCWWGNPEWEEKKKGQCSANREK